MANNVIQLRPEPKLEPSWGKRVSQWFTNWLAYALTKFEPSETYDDMGHECHEEFHHFNICYTVYPSRICFDVYIPPVKEPMVTGFITADGSKSFEGSVQLQQEVYDRMTEIANERQGRFCGPA